MDEERALRETLTSHRATEAFKTEGKWDSKQVVRPIFEAKTNIKYENFTQFFFFIDFFLSVSPLFSNSGMLKLKLNRPK